MATSIKGELSVRVHAWRMASKSLRALPFLHADLSDEVRLGRARLATRDSELSFGYFRDVSPERDAVEALRRSEARFRFLVEAAPDGVVILVRGQIVFINERGAQLLARDIAKQVEEELSYPGQIKVTVVRESRAVEVAR